MSAPGQAAAGGDAGQGQVQQGEAQADGGNDVAQQLQALQDSQRQMFEMLQSQPWQQQDVGEQQVEQQEIPELDLSFLDSPDLSADQIGEHLSSLIDQRAEARAQELLKPFEARLNEREQKEAADAFVQEFPEVGEPETAKQVMDLTKQYAEMIGQPALASDFRFARLVYMAGRAADAHNEEQAAESAGAVSLEGGGGAVPGGSAQVDFAQRIINGGEDRPTGRAALPFM